MKKILLIIIALTSMLGLTSITYAKEGMVTIPNRPPVIITDTLPWGQVGVWYRARIKAVDLEKDVIGMTIKNLPSGFAMRSCTEELGRLSCQISGMTKEAGIYWLEVKAWDEHNASTYKILMLRIN